MKAMADLLPAMSLLPSFVHLMLFVILGHAASNAFSITLHRQCHGHVANKIQNEKQTFLAVRCCSLLL